MEILFVLKGRPELGTNLQVDPEITTTGILTSLRLEGFPVEIEGGHHLLDPTTNREINPRTPLRLTGIRDGEVVEIT